MEIPVEGKVIHLGSFEFVRYLGWFLKKGRRILGDERLEDE
jgi:hypothetical protein